MTKHRFALSPEAYILFAISILDFVTTAWLLHAGKAIEVNPILDYYLDAGPQWFMVYKSVVLCLIPIGLIEWLRQRNPPYEKRLRFVLRAGIIGYAVLYVTMVSHVNVR